MEAAAIGRTDASHRQPHLGGKRPRRYRRSTNGGSTDIDVEVLKCEIKKTYVHDGEGI
jgi:hypothetical protein